MFESPGSYRVIDHPTGLPLLFVLGKDNVLRCFHNVCRHRAYPVASTRRIGKTPLLTCGYHGWTYNLEGKLIKAPKFEGVEGFHKDQNSLFQVSIKIDSDGLVFVDLSKPVDLHDAMEAKWFGGGQTVTWEVEGKFNWKVAGKNLP